MVSLSTGPLSAVSTAQSPPPTKPSIRRSSLVRKRDDDDDPIPSSPSKRNKVAFSNDVEVRVLADLQDTPAFVQAEVNQAFEKRAWGDCEDYEQLKSTFAPKKDAEPASPAVIKRYTIGLLSNVSRLDRASSDLVHAILNSKWLGMPDDYVSLFMRLLANILSSQGMFLSDTLRMLVQNLTSSPPSYRRFPKLAPVLRKAIYTRIHKALHYLLQLLPPAASILSSIIVSVFPHPTDSSKAHATYVKNLLRLGEYAPQLKSNVINLITERLVKVDVQVQVDLEDFTDEAGESLINRLPRQESNILDDITDDEITDSESESEEEEAGEDAQKTKDIIQNVEKMDIMLDVMFSYHDNTFSNTPSERHAAIIDTLLSQFVSIILPTHRSRHTQFILFHFLQQSSAHIDTFVGACVQIAFQSKQPALMRQAAAAYLGSFVARGIHVPSNIVWDVFDYLGNELARLRQAHEPGCKGPDLRRYSIYYSLVQALLYIFCFRWKELEVVPEEDYEDHNFDTSLRHGRQWRPGLKETLSANVFCKLNPLKVCSPAVVNEFARIANHLEVVYVYHLLETNKRIRLSHLSGSMTSGYKFGEPMRETALSRSNDERHFHLDEYFPFDPYHLPRSKHWIEGDYREWSGIPGLDDVQSDASSTEDDEDGGDNEIEEGTETDQTR